MITRILFLSILFWGSGFNLPAQTPNNNIESAIPLELDSAVSSRTHGNTVQWACVDESLTGKCIEYHNDQWFTFTPAQHYEFLCLNIYQQQCRDVKGVQAVVFTGQPCQPQTYQILNCSSLATQDNIFILLERLIAGQTYFINIDGYLEDYCQFTLQVSTTAKGLSAEARDLLDMQATVSSDSVTLRIDVPEGLAAQYTELALYRREASQPHRTLKAALPLRFSHGSTLSYLTLGDSLISREPVTYTLVGTDSLGNYHSIAQTEVKPKPPKGPAPNTYVEFSLSYKHRTPLEIRVWNPLTGKLLRRRLVEFSKHQPLYRLNTHDYQARGIQKIRVEVIDTKKNQSQEFHFNLPN